MKIINVEKRKKSNVLDIIEREAVVPTRLKETDWVVKIEDVLLYQQYLFIIYEKMHCTLGDLIRVQKEIFNDGFS